MKCRFCQHELTQQFVDLGSSPPSNSFLRKEQLTEPEIFYPLKLYICEKCRLVQAGEYKKADEIFSRDYIYFSSYSKSWLEHAERYVEMIRKRLKLNKSSFVIEIGSNDGYLLQYFQQKNIPCLGIDPAEGTAMAAKEKGIVVLTEFFGRDLSEKLVARHKTADLLIGNNVLAQVPDINDFVMGLKTALKPHGVITMEFPHLMCLAEQNQFDTIYHEHFSYFSFHAVKNIFGAFGLELFDVEEFPTHGGSLRIYAKHQGDSRYVVSPAVARMLQAEIRHGMLKAEYYRSFQQKADEIKYSLVSFLIQQKRIGKKVAAYGAAAKGNTLLNYCGIKKDLIAFVADASIHKQDRFLPGSHIRVVGEEEIGKFEPDFVLILPWNLQEEICAQLEYIRRWQGQFVVPIPEVKIF